jgi:hypothetical protein
LTFSITNLTIGLLIVSIFSVGFSGLYLSMANTYDVNVPSEYAELYNQFNETNEQIIATEQTVGEGQINEDAQDIAIFKSAITAGKQIGNSAKFTISALGDVNKVMAIPNTMILIISSIIIFAVSMAFLAYVLRGRTP